MKENEKKSRILLQLFITFMKIGTFTFGGGYAMIPLIQRETVVKRKWVDDEDILNIVAIAESTPGPIACWRILGSCCWNGWHDTAVICNNTGDFFCIEKISGYTDCKVCI